MARSCANPDCGEPVKRSRRKFCSTECYNVVPRTRTTSGKCKRGHDLNRTGSTRVTANGVEVVRLRCEYCTRANRFARLYSIPVETVLAFGLSYECEICGKHDENINLDHNHETGELRGWLCSACNRGLGYFRDNEYMLQKAIDYLEVRGSYGKGNV